MIFFALTRAGYDEFRQLLGDEKAELWLNGDVLTDQEVEQLREEGWSVSRFSYVIDLQDQVSVDSAISVVQEHHAEQTIWVEFRGLSYPDA